MALGTPRNIVVDDTKRAKALKLTTDIQAKLEAAAKGITKDTDIHWRDKLVLLGRLEQQLNWAQDLDRDLSAIFLPTVIEPEPLEP